MRIKVLLVSTLALVMMSQTTMAASSLSLTAGDYVISGSIFVDNDSQNDGTFSQAAGIGNVTEIRHADGTLVFDNSLAELSLRFSGFTRTALAPGLGGTIQFTSSGGLVEFFDNTLGTFQATGDFLADGLAMENNPATLILQGFADAFGNVAVGQFSDTSYASNGFLEVIGGSLASLFDTDAIDLGPAGLADMTFNISGDNMSTANYDFSGSADLAVTTIPEPAGLLLVAMGLAVAGFSNKR